MAGLPNASLPVIVRCLELGLKEHYRQVERAEPSMTLYELIEWAEKSLGKKKALAHGFRILRNLFHEDKIIEEQDALEAIRHVTKILNMIFPFGEVDRTEPCGFCKAEYAISISSEYCYLGNTIIVQCENCRRSGKYPIMP